MPAGERSGREPPVGWRRWPSSKTCTSGSQLRRPRRGPHLGLRRHVPHEQLDVHLRPGLPGRAHRAGARARARLLLLRRPLHRARTTAATSSRMAERLTAEQWQFRKRGDEAGRPDQGERRRRHRHPPRRRRLHLPQPARVRRRARAAPSTAPRSSRRAVHGPEARGVLAAPAAPGRRHRRLRPRHLDACASGSGATGARAAQEFHWWCTEPPRPSSAHEPGVPGDARRADRAGRARALRVFVGHVEAAPRQRPRTATARPPPTSRTRRCGSRSAVRLAGEAPAVLLGEHPLADADGVGGDLDQLVVGDELDRRLEGERPSAARA